VKVGELQDGCFAVGLDRYESSADALDVARPVPGGRFDAPRGRASAVGVVLDDALGRFAGRDGFAGAPCRVEVVADRLAVLGLGGELAVGVVGARQCLPTGVFGG
jgi:hypothetical protein